MILKFIRTLIDDYRIGHVVDEASLPAEQRSLEAAVDYALKNFPEDAVVREAKARTELFKRQLFKQRPHDA